MAEDAVNANVAQGGIKIDGQVTIGSGDIVGRDKIINNIQQILQRVLTVAEEAALARSLETQALAQGLNKFIERLRGQVGEMTEDGGPYRGLLDYRLSDAEIFFGRRRAVRELLEVMARGPLTILHAESGAGKTSLLQAGLSPVLINAGHLPLYLRPYRNEPGLFIRRAFAAEPSAQPLRDFLRQVCDILGASTSLYILLDQFEEFFIHVAADAQTQFIQALAECMDDSSLHVHWVLALRREFFSDAANFEPPIRNPLANSYRLNHLTQAEAQEAITEPARKHNLKFEKGLVDQILNQLGQDAVQPPQMQLVCSALYEEAKRSGQRTITRAIYKRKKGADGILREYLNTVLKEGLSGERRSIARRVLEALITSDGRRAVRTLAELNTELNLSPAPPAPLELLSAVMGQLVSKRLLRVQEHDPDSEILAYELAHEYLVEAIELDPHTQARKAAQELLEQEVRVYTQHGSLMTADRVEIIKSYRAELRFSPEAEKLYAESETAVQKEINRREKLRRRELQVAKESAQAERERAEAERQRAEAEHFRAEVQGKTIGQLRRLLEWTELHSLLRDLEYRLDSANALFELPVAPHPDLTLPWKPVKLMIDQLKHFASTLQYIDSPYNPQTGSGPAWLMAILEVEDKIDKALSAQKSKETADKAWRDLQWTFKDFKFVLQRYSDQAEKSIRDTAAEADMAARKAGRSDLWLHLTPSRDSD